MRSLRELARFASKVTAAYPTATGALASGNSIAPAVQSRAVEPYFRPLLALAGLH